MACTGHSCHIQAEERGGEVGVRTKTRALDENSNRLLKHAGKSICCYEGSSGDGHILQCSHVHEETHVQGAHERTPERCVGNAGVDVGNVTAL